MLDGKHPSHWLIYAQAIMTEGDGLFPALREAVGNGVPAYGTCAGLILLADDCVGQKAGGQALVGGLDCTVCRNYLERRARPSSCPSRAFRTRRRPYLLGRRRS